jgi:18S rRNA (guanine1575-N7)-methyltransferase
MRPEHENPPEIYYNDDEARKYTVNTRVQQIQGEMTERAIELLNLPDGKPCIILDIGCGSGLSGEVLQEYGHEWVGLDISESMLKVAREDEDSTGDLFLQDAGQGVGYRPGSFDGCISISCLQWLCNADYKGHNPRKRLMKLFVSLYAALAHGARAVFQFYPENADQIAIITGTAMQAGFTGGLVVDFPNSSKRKKYFLCLFAGSGSVDFELPQGLSDEMSIIGGEDEETMNSGKIKNFGRQRERQSKSKRKINAKDREWVLKKKASRRKKGEIVQPDTKYTARKRKPQF